MKWGIESREGLAKRRRRRGSEVELEEERSGLLGKRIDRVQRREERGHRDSRWGSGGGREKAGWHRVQPQGWRVGRGERGRRMRGRDWRT